MTTRNLILTTISMSMVRSVMIRTAPVMITHTTTSITITITASMTTMNRSL